MKETYRQKNSWRNREGERERERGGGESDLEGTKRGTERCNHKS
jgi:hypothetical protein